MNMLISDYNGPNFSTDADSDNLNNKAASTLILVATCTPSICPLSFIRKPLMEVELQ